MDQVRTTIRGVIKEIAVLVDAISEGRIRPNHITILSLLGHVVIALAIYDARFTEAALMLVAFGLMDTLDGELAKVQSSGTEFGAMLDSITDRLKEVFVYTAFALYFTRINSDSGVGWAVLALGLSIVISYTRAKLEIKLATETKETAAQIGKKLARGIFQFEIRMAILVIGLIINRPLEAMILIVLGGAYTIIERMIIGHNLTKKADKPTNDSA